MADPFEEFRELFKGSLFSNLLDGEGDDMPSTTDDKFPHATLRHDYEAIHKCLKDALGIAAKNCKLSKTTITADLKKLIDNVEIGVKSILFQEWLEEQDKKKE